MHCGTWQCLKASSLTTSVGRADLKVVGADDDDFAARRGEASKAAH